MLTCFYEMSSLWQIILIVISQLTMITLLACLLLAYRRYGISKPFSIGSVLLLFNAAVISGGTLTPGTAALVDVLVDMDSFAMRLNPCIAFLSPHSGFHLFSLIQKQPPEMRFFGGAKCKKANKNTGPRSQHSYPLPVLSYFPSIKYSKKPMYA